MDNQTLYHADIHLPEQARTLQFAALLRYTSHALQAAREDRYGPITLPQVFDSRCATLIEAGVEADRVVKAVYRQQYDDMHDLCLVLNLRMNRVITVWLNRRDDHHHTLDRSKYAEA